MHLLLTTILLITFHISSAQKYINSIKNDELSSSLFKSLTNSTNYNKFFMPIPEDGGPLEVNVRAYIYHLKARETTKLDITMQLLLELSWEDARLSYEEESTGLKMISGGKEHLKSIWTPHLFFTNEKESYVIGKIRRYSSHQLNLVWDKRIPLQIEKLKTSLPEFDILSINNVTSLDNNSEEDKGKPFSSLTIRLDLKRHYGYYFINYYLPSVLLVIISWVPFWYEPAAISAGRVTIGISTMLTFISLCWSAQGIQSVSQFLTTDVWAVTCTAFIILSLVESAFVNTIDRKGGGEKVQIKKLSSKHIFRGGVDYAAGRAKLRRSSSCPSSPEIRQHFAQKKQNRSKMMRELKEMSLSLGNLGSSRGIQQSAGHHNVFTMTPQEIAIWIDTKSRIVFPTAFFIFNIIYWLPLVIVKG